MVWGGNRYVEVFIGGGGTQKGPQYGKTTADTEIGPPPHGKKCSQYREKCSKKPLTWRKSSKEALYNIRTKKKSPK